jgi:multidrug efflux pump subunit AcrA (membrane-fusion protein)
MSKIVIGAALLFLSNSVLAGDSVILSGRVKAGDNQTFYSPKTDSWRVQVQWMLPEGDIAQKGDLVVVFDGSSIESSIEQGVTSLLAAKEELFRLESKSEQDLLEAVYAQKRTALLLQKARIDAQVTKEHLSGYDYQKNQLDYEKSLIANAKSQEQLAQTKVANQVALNKQKFTITQLKEKLDYNKNKLSKMGVKAQRSGPVIYGTHPWNGEKVFVGMTAQPSWEIAEIPSLNGLYIEAWVHEVDFQLLQLNRKANLTLDAYQLTPISAILTEVSTQPEERKEWGNDVYYRAVFQFENVDNLKILPGMSGQLELEKTDKESS